MNNERNITLTEPESLDLERKDTLEHAIAELNEVIFSLEGILDGENEQYREMRDSLREPREGEPAGGDRQIIEAAILSLCDGLYVLANWAPRRDGKHS